MPLVNTKNMFQHAYENGYAVGAFNVDSIAMVQSVLQAAHDLRSPVIISISKGSRNFMHPGNIKDMVECVAKDITIPYAIHLDHGDSYEVCKDCIDEGFTSVMIDCGDDATFEERIALTKRVVEYAHAHGATVEGELGELGAEDAHGTRGFSSPQMVQEFVLRTGVDCLAVSVGTGHGLKKFADENNATLQFDLIKQMMELLPNFPFVLHGSSSINNQNLQDFNQYGGCIEGALGVPEEQIRQAVKLGICKVNIGTDFRVAYVGALRKSLALKPSRFEPRNFLQPAKQAAYDLVYHKIDNVFGSKGQI